MFEDKSISNKYREEYRNSIINLIQRMQEEARKERFHRMPPDCVRDNQETYRNQLRQLLGWPLTLPKPTIPPEMILRDTIDLGTHEVRRVQFEIFSGFRYYGMVFIPKKISTALPLVVCQHGGHGTPELCSDFHGENHYSHVVTELMKKDVIILVPLMLLWREDEDDKPCFPGYGLPYNRNETDAALRQLGGSLASLEAYCLIRSLDALCLLQEVDENHLAMIGLSYGGFYTQLVAALDTRILSAHSSAFFCERESFCWPDFAWKDAAYQMQDAEICALIAPRRLTLEMGHRDNKFDYEKSQKEFRRLVPYYDAWDAAEKLTLSIVDTDHQYFQVENIIDRLLEGMYD